MPTTAKSGSRKAKTNAPLTTAAETPENSLSLLFSIIESCWFKTVRMKNTSRKIRLDSKKSDLDKSSRGSQIQSFSCFPHLFIPAQYQTTISADTTRAEGSTHDWASPSIASKDTIVLPNFTHSGSRNRRKRNNNKKHVYSSVTAALACWHTKSNDGQVVLSSFWAVKVGDEFYY
jgi:hypothetical protein